MPKRTYPWVPRRDSTASSSAIDWAYISTYRGRRSRPLVGRWIGRSYDQTGAIRGLSVASSRHVWAFWIHQRKY
jgi:hypothetical protein